MAISQGTTDNDYLVGTGSDDGLYGFEGDDYIYGDDGDDVLVGGNGGDTLDGGAGADVMIGGEGNDTYYVDDSGDTIVEGQDYGDTDIVYVSASYFDIGSAIVEQIYYSGSESATIIGGGNNNFINADGGDDSLYGLGGDDWLIGGGGDDHLEGGVGNDELDGWQGADTMIGGVGDDVYNVDSSSDVVVEYADEGMDTVRVRRSSYTLATHFENADLRYFSGSIWVNGNSADNLFIMGAGEQAVVGGAGSDTVSYAYTGAVSVDLWTWDFGGEAADDYLSGIENLTGSGYDDVLRALGGASIIDGGLGADIMEGRNGGDTYYVDNSGDVVIEAAGGGIDEVRIRGISTYALPAYVEKLSNSGNVYGFGGFGNSLSNEINGGLYLDYLHGGDGDDTLNGGDGDDELHGDDGHDLLAGGPGSDLMYGGLGNDVFHVESAGDTVVELVGEGTDHVYTGLTTYVLADHVENLTYTGAGDPALDYTGSNVGNYLFGLANDDRLSGLGGADELQGHAGDDVLDGGSGDDLLIGGTGSDVLTGGAGGDLFRFFEGDSGAGAAADRITDYVNWVDKIDLRDVDANRGAAGDQAFSFIGTSAFSSSAGELRFGFDGTNTWLQGDCTGDGVADFEIVFTGNVYLLVTDFYL